MDNKNGDAAAGQTLQADGGGPWGGRGGGGDSGGSGGGDGGGPKNPWQQPPGGGKPRKPRGPSAMDEFQRKMRDQFGGNMPGGGAESGKLIKYGLIGFLGLWILFTSFHRVDPQERGVVTRFGAYSRTLSSGVGVTLP